MDRKAQGVSNKVTSELRYKESAAMKLPVSGSIGRVFTEEKYKVSVSNKVARDSDCSPTRTVHSQVQSG